MARRYPMIKDKRTIRKITFLIFIVVVFILLAVLMFTGRRFNSDALLRAFSYMRDQKDAQGQLKQLEFISTAKSAYADYEGGIAVAASTGIEIIGRNGETVLSYPVDFDSPAIESSGKRVLAYDIGGTSALCFEGGKKILDIASDEAIISAHMNDDGWIVLTTEASGYKALITVYNADMEAVYRYYSSTAYVVSAVVDPGNRTMTAASVLYDESGFQSKLVRFRFDSEAPEAEGYIEDRVPLAIKTYSDNRSCVVTESAIYFLDEELRTTAQYDYGSAYLKNAVLTGEAGPVLFLGEQRTGTKARVVSLSTDGKVLANSEVARELLDISAAGSYIAMLYADCAEILTASLQQESRTESSNNARRIIMRDDGTALLVSSGEARLFVP
jgi:hypothetical protein